MNPTLLTTPFAASGDKNTIPATSSTAEVVSQATGWGANYSVPLASGGYAPKRIDMNGVFNLLSNILFHCQKGFTFEYDSSQAYYAGCIIRDTDLYYCTSSVNSGAAGHRPSTDTSNTHWIKLTLMFDNTPVGTVQAWAGDTTKTNSQSGYWSYTNSAGVTYSGIPNGWIVCDGSTLSPTTYAELFNVIGYKYSGSTTSGNFSLPNLVSKFIEGTDGNSGSSIEAGLPNITGEIGRTKEAVGDSIAAMCVVETSSGAFGYTEGNYNNFDKTTVVGSGTKTITFNAFDSNSIYGSSSTVQPAAVYMRYIIKYKKG